MPLRRGSGSIRDSAAGRGVQREELEAGGHVERLHVEERSEKVDQAERVVDAAAGAVRKRDQRGADDGRSRQLTVHAAGADQIGSEKRSVEGVGGAAPV